MIDKFSWDQVSTPAAWVVCIPYTRASWAQGEYNTPWVNIYINLPDVGTVKKVCSGMMIVGYSGVLHGAWKILQAEGQTQDVSCDFTDTSFDLQVRADSCSSLSRGKECGCPVNQSVWRWLRRLKP